MELWTTGKALFATFPGRVLNGDLPRFRRGRDDFVGHFLSICILVVAAAWGGRCLGKSIMGAVQ